MRSEFLRGLRAFFRDSASVNNFILLSAAYFVGIGIPALIFKIANRDKTRAKADSTSTFAIPSAVTTYWQDLDAGKKNADAYYRPF